jgi:anti-sigma factor RsiW
MTQPTQSDQYADRLSPDHLSPDQLNAFIDGELPPAAQQGSEQHLASCHA